MKRSAPALPNRLGAALTAPRKAAPVYLTAFFLPVVLLGMLWLVNGTWPFGTKMILAHDQWHQYYPFYLDLRARLHSGASLLHSWTTGMGTAYLPLFAYYLASPLNFVAAILPESLAMPWYNITVLCRIGCAGLFCAVFLRQYFQRRELSVAVFSTMYALCSFIMGYYWNAIWLDTVALLPLVALGTFRLLRQKKYVLYVASLALSIYCSYYVGLFTCIFVLLLFIGYNFVNWDDLGGFWSRLFRIALFSALAIGLTAAVTIPAFLGLQATSSAVNKFPTGLALNIAKDKTWLGALDAFRQVISNTGAMITPTSMEGLPNIYCGVSTLVLAFLYLFCRRIPLRERLYSLFLLLFFAASFIFRQLDYVWHGLHFPNMLPYRFSFLWSFVVIFMAFRAYTQLERVRWYHLLLLLIPLVPMVYCVCAVQKARTIIATLIVIALVGAGLLLYCRRLIPKTALVLVLCFIMVLESFSCALLGVETVGFTTGDSYPSKAEDVAVLVAQMNEREQDNQDLWRAEVTTKQTLNDGTLLGYRGVSVFSSAANAKVSQFTQSIGMAASVAGNRYSYQQADPFINMLLGLKYLIDRDDRGLDASYFSKVATSGQVSLWENEAYLPLGFVVSDDALDYDASDVTGVPFDRLNRLHKLMTGTEDELYQRLETTEAEAIGTAELTRSTRTDYSFTAEQNSEDDALAVSWDIPYEAHLCIYSKTTDCQDVVVFVNGVRQYTYSDKYGYLRWFGRFAAGDRVSLRFRPKAGKTGSVTLGAALFQSQVFDRTRAQLAETSMLTTLVTDTEIEGAVSVKEPGLLYLSIPNDRGWQLFVDDKPAKITPLGDAMIACALDAGLHTVRLEYEAPGFNLGVKISVICLGVFLALVVLALVMRLTTPPMDKITMTLADPDRDLDEEDEGEDLTPYVPTHSADSVSLPQDATMEVPRQSPTTSMPPLDMTQPIPRRADETDQDQADAE